MKKITGLLTGTLICILMLQNCQKSEFMVVTGVVRDSATHEPLPNSYVVTSMGYAFTDKDGTFTFRDIQPGKQSLRAFNFNGYYSKEKSIVLTAGRVNKIDFALAHFENPRIRTGKILDTNDFTATVSGSFKLDASDQANAYGHVWSSTNPMPTVQNSYRTVNWTNQKELDFTSQLSTLKSDQLYYVRAYIQTNTGYVYGNTVTFRTGDYSGILMSYSFNGRDNYWEESGNGFYTYYYEYLPDWVPDRHNIPNMAAEFDGTINPGILTYGPDLNLQDFSISLWFNKPGNWENASQKLFTIGYQWNLQVYISQGPTPQNFYFGIRKNGIDYKVTLNSYPSPNTWHHVVALRRNSTLELYIDNTLVGTANCSNEIIRDYSNYLFIGFTWPTEPFRGKLDDLKIYDHALSNQEIQTLYLK